MKLIRQVTLHFQEGKSDKIYEVDLAEVAPGRFVVNFRYGRRGTTYKEGAKTVQAVARADAERIFADLVQEKVQKGYREIGSQTAAAAPSEPTPSAEPAAVMRRLAS